MEPVAPSAPLEELLGRLLRATGPADRVPEAAGPPVSPSEARALFGLLAARGIAQGELAGLLGLEKSTISRLAAGLERKGWIRRGRDTANQRYVRLYLTPEGRAVAARLWAAWRDRQTRILQALTEQERAGLTIGLGGLIRALAAEGLLGDIPGLSGIADEVAALAAAADGPAADGPAADGPAADGPVTDGPVTGAAAADSRVTGGAAGQARITDGPVTDGAVADPAGVHGTTAHGA